MWRREVDAATSLVDCRLTLSIDSTKSCKFYFSGPTPISSYLSLLPNETCIKKSRTALLYTTKSTTAASDSKMACLTHCHDILFRTAVLFQICLSAFPYWGSCDDHRGSNFFRQRGGSEVSQVEKPNFNYRPILVVSLEWQRILSP